MQKNKLSEIIVGLLASGTPFTDIHIATNKQITLRQSPWKFVPAEIDGSPVIVTVAQILNFLNGAFVGVENRAVDKGEAEKWRAQLDDHGALHPAFNISGIVGNEAKTFRVRCLIQKQMMGQEIGMMIRRVPEVPKNVAAVGLPYQVERMLKQSYRGLVIVTGPTGAGKSTSLAAMLNELNETRHGNILTIEDPVEFVHDPKMCIINQREVGIDVDSFTAGARDAQRYVPDIVLYGEIRDADTMIAAVRSAEMGTLVFGSMHAPTAAGAVRKMLAWLSGSQADMQSLPHLLVGIVAQALVRDKSSDGNNHLAFEFLDCRDTTVLQAISESAGDGGQQQSLGNLERQLVAGELGDVGIPMLASLKALVTKGAVEPQSAAAAVTTADEKAQLLKLNVAR